MLLIWFFVIFKFILDGADATQCNNDDGNEEFPTVSLSEMIQDLKIDNDVEMEEEIS